MKWTLLLVKDSTKEYQPVGSFDSKEVAERVKELYEKIYPEHTILVDTKEPAHE